MKFRSKNSVEYEKDADGLTQLELATKIEEIDHCIRRQIIACRSTSAHEEMKQIHENEYRKRNFSPNVGFRLSNRNLRITQKIDFHRQKLDNCKKILTEKIKNALLWGDVRTLEVVVGNGTSLNEGLKTFVKNTFDLPVQVPSDNSGMLVIEIPLPPFN